MFIPLTGLQKTYTTPRSHECDNAGFLPNDETVVLSRDTVPRTFFFMAELKPFASMTRTFDPLGKMAADTSEGVAARTAISGTVSNIVGCCRFDNLRERVKASEGNI